MVTDEGRELDLKHTFNYYDTITIPLLHYYYYYI